ncbi:MAG: DUF4157 domain-containing protein [Gammaproteobacteria bacterium]|nr:DUF4157 domain-containing protein [Gammaproteobacteria bacterium]MBU1554866.1 DUF4157 domain-containing protein [Gammaproteobacteria bacterium]
MSVQHSALQQLQRKQLDSTVSQQISLDEEIPMQGKFDVAQQAALEDEEPLQGKFAAVVSQRQAESRNNTGMPDQLKSGIERLSGHAMDDVKVHYNSAKPAAMQAHAYAQGTDIHIAPGQEKHLPHEAWHVAQQKQGRVKATTQLKGEAINDDPGLEHEADVMGAKALQCKLIQAKVTQREKFDAGSGSVWHIHYDHIKLGNNQDSRVNFNGRSKKEIRQELGEKIDRYGLNVGGDLAASFRACIDYINAHF